MSIASNITK